MVIIVTESCLCNISPASALAAHAFRPRASMTSYTTMTELYLDCDCARAGRGDGMLCERGAPASAFKARGRCKQPGALAYAIAAVITAAHAKF